MIVETQSLHACTAVQARDAPGNLSAAHAECHAECAGRDQPLRRVVRPEACLSSVVFLPRVVFGCGNAGVGELAMERVWKHANQSLCTWTMDVSMYAGRR